MKSLDTILIMLIVICILVIYDTIQIIRKYEMSKYLETLRYKEFIYSIILSILTSIIIAIVSYKIFGT